MIKFPEELIGVTEFDNEGNRVLKKEATEEQKHIFKQFYRDLEDGTLSDVIIEYED